MEGEAAQQNKNLPEGLKQGLPAQLRLTMLGKDFLASPATECDPLTHVCSDSTIYLSEVRIFGLITLTRTLIIRRHKR